MILRSSLLFLINGSDPDMAHLKTGSYHHVDIADHWFAIGLLAFKRKINREDHPGGDYHHAAGIAAFGFRILSIDGIQP